MTATKPDHWIGNSIILMKLSSMAAPEVVKLTTSGAASDDISSKWQFAFGYKTWSTSNEMHFITHLWQISRWVHVANPWHPFGHSQSFSGRFPQSRRWHVPPRVESKMICHMSHLYSHIHTENQKLSWFRLHRNWWHRKLLWQTTIPPVTTNLVSWRLLVFSVNHVGDSLGRCMDGRDTLSVQVHMYGKPLGTVKQMLARY